MKKSKLQSLGEMRVGWAIAVFGVCAQSRGLGSGQH